MSEVPLYGAYKTVKAIFWHWLSGKSPQTPLSCSVDVRLPGKGNSKLPSREAGPLNHLDDTVDSDQ